MSSGASGAIFLLRDDDTLTPMREEPYDSEELLQRLLAQHPDLLAGELMNRTAPLRWLLVRREAGVPSGQAQRDRWSIDHLFLDQDGVPTIVEVKRSSDTRLRREVVGQMLDYAANAVLYWPPERIRLMFEEDYRTRGVDPEAAVSEVLGIDGEPEEELIEEFWQKVEQNLSSRNVRMVFVADVIPPELQRIVEFLNEQMKPAEVLAVEVRQYVGEASRTLVPRVYGLSAEAQMRKRSASHSIDEATFLAELPGEYAAAIQSFLATCREAGLVVFWGTVGCSVRTGARERFAPLSIAWLNPPGRPGWAGLIDVTFGVDWGSLEKLSPHLLDNADNYFSQVAALPGERAVETKGMRACSFSPSDFTARWRELAD